ncbi:MAG: formate hydrogenlyase transcriptional activator [Desulforhopalus sp.]|jgi:formate hydrogenlyase transcriptional activator
MSQELLKVTFEQAAVGIAHVLPNGKFLRINQKFCDIVGYTKKEMQSRTFLEITHPDDLDADLKFVQQVLDGEIDTYSMEKRYLQKDHEIVWINLTVSLFREDTGDPSYFIAVVQDISERKEMEDRFRLLVEQAGDAFFILDYDGVIFDINRQACLSLGYSREELLGMKISEVDIEVEKMKHKLQFWSSLEPGRYITFEGLHRRKDENTFPVEVRLGRLDLRKKRFLLALCRDITDRKQKEEKLEKHGQFQKLVYNISSKFIGLSGAELKRAIQDALVEVGGYFEVDSVRLFRLSLDGSILNVRTNWLAGHVVPPEEMPEILKMKLPNMATHYSQGKSVLFESMDECPQLPDLRKILNIFGTRAGVGVPLEIDESGVDIFAMDKILSEHTWPEDIIEKSRSLGHIMLSALRRKETENELQGRYDDIKQLKKRLEQENIHLRKEIEILYSHDEIVGKSRAIKNVLSQAEQVAEQETSVLVLGETGTGKELLARAIHNISPRKARAMITVNCAALPPTLVEGELFGREKGAYTGALTKQAGRFEVADKSTIFLDEIGDLPMEMQAKLLRVLQEGQFERLGSVKTITVDVRVIAATNHDLELAIREGRFRKDLFYRLSVFPITVPPLRDRTEDIPMLVWAFVKDLGTRMGKTVEKISKETMDMLQSYTWPGNVRELRNVIERSMILHSGQTLHIEITRTENQEIDQPTSLKEIEGNHILSILNKTNWKVSGKNGAAEALGLKESTLRARMAKLGIKRKK